MCVGVGRGGRNGVWLECLGSLMSQARQRQDKILNNVNAVETLEEFRQVFGALILSSGMSYDPEWDISPL